MKIIREGTLLLDREYRVTCSRCGTIFEFFGKEAKKMSRYFDIRCPICSKKNLVPLGNFIEAE